MKKMFVIILLSIPLAVSAFQPPSAVFRIKNRSEESIFFERYIKIDGFNKFYEYCEYQNEFLRKHGVDVMSDEDILAEYLEDKIWELGFSDNLWKALDKYPDELFTCKRLDKWIFLSFEIPPGRNFEYVTEKGIAYHESIFSLRQNDLYFFNCYSWKDVRTKLIFFVATMLRSPRHYYTVRQLCHKPRESGPLLD